MQCRRSLTNATGGSVVSSCGVRGRTRKATGRKNINFKQKEQPVINITHWNAEGVSSKREEMHYLLHENNVNICCVQETHVQDCKPLISSHHNPTLGLLQVLMTKRTRTAAWGICVVLCWDGGVKKSFLCENFPHRNSQDALED